MTDKKNHPKFQHLIADIISCYNRTEKTSLFTTFYDIFVAFCGENREFFTSLSRNVIHVIT